MSADLSNQQHFDRVNRYSEVPSKVQRENSDRIMEGSEEEEGDLGSMYLCENVFSSMRSKQTKSRNCMYLKYDLVVSVNTLPPRIQDLTRKRQRQTQKDRVHIAGEYVIRM